MPLSQRPNISLSGCDGRADVAFLIDSSGSIQYERFDDYVKPFVMSVIAELDVGSDRTRVASAIFSNTARVVFYLDQYTNREDAMTAVRQIEFTDGRTNIDAGLSLVRTKSSLQPEGTG